MKESSRCLTPHWDSSHTQPLGRLFKQHTIRWSISFPYNVDVFSFCPFAILMRSDDDDVWSENILWVRVSALALILSPMLKWHRSTYVYSINLIHYIPTYSRTLSINRRRTKLLFLLFSHALCLTFCANEGSQRLSMFLVSWFSSVFLTMMMMVLQLMVRVFLCSRTKNNNNGNWSFVSRLLFRCLSYTELISSPFNLNVKLCFFFCVVNIWGDSCFMYTLILWLAYNVMQLWNLSFWVNSHSQYQLKTMKRTMDDVNWKISVKIGKSLHLSAKMC